MSGPIILPYRNVLPRIHPTAFVAPGVVVIGDVEIGAHANIWFNVVIRGDDAPIRIGAGANIQDGTVVHVTDDTLVAPASTSRQSSARMSRLGIWHCCMPARSSPALSSA